MDSYNGANSDFYTAKYATATTLTNGGDWQDSKLAQTMVGDRSVVTVRPFGPADFFRVRGL